MSTAPDYTPGTSFADDESNNVAGRSIVKTTSLDTELAGISSSINAVNSNLQNIQRDDNKLKDEIVEPYALAEQTRALIAVAGCNPRGTWAQNTNYKFKDVIQQSNIAQICLQDHNSGTVFTQSFWLPISGDGTSAANAAVAAASAAAASSSASTASTSATNASNSANSASTSANTATTQATNAGNSASSAASSAVNATSQAGIATTQANNAAASAASISAKIQSITATQAAGAITTNYAGGNLDFRSATLTTGTPNTLAVAPNNGVIPSGATLGVPTGNKGRIAVLEYYNAGSPVLGWINTAGGQQLDEMNLVSPTTISGGATSASTFYSASAVAASSPYRVIGFFDAVNAAGAWASPTFVQGVGGEVDVKSQPSQIRLNTSNGYGSTNTRILRYVNAVLNVGNDITYADNAAGGASITINTPGLYAISAGYNNAATGGQFGLSLNTTQPTTNIASITATDILAISTCGSANSLSLSVNFVGYFKAGDVIRPHADNASTASAGVAYFNIVKLDS